MLRPRTGPHTPARDVLKNNYRCTKFGRLHRITCCYVRPLIFTTMVTIFLNIETAALCAATTLKVAFVGIEFKLKRLTRKLLRQKCIMRISTFIIFHKLHWDDITINFNFVYSNLFRQGAKNTHDKSHLTNRNMN